MSDRDDIVPSLPINELEDVPGQTTADVGVGIASAALQAVPVVGGTFARLFELAIGPSLNRRRDEWMRKVGEAVDELQARLDGFDPRDLAGNEQFVTTVLNASTAAMRTHDAEKLDLLRNAIVNGLLPGAPAEWQQLTFVRYVDELTPQHVAVLAFLDNPGAWYDAHGLERPQFMHAGLAAITGPAFAELSASGALMQIVHDLDQRRLTDAGGVLGATMSNAGLWAERTTPLGKAFLGYVTLPPVRNG